MSTISTRRAIALLVATAWAGGCQSDHEVVGPAQPPAEYLPAAIQLRIDVRSGVITTIAGGSAPGTSAVSATGPGPSFALLGQNEIGVVTSNLSASAVGAFQPNRVRVTFDLALANKMLNSDLVPSSFPAAPAPQVVAFPFATTPAGLFGLKVRASTDWDGAPYDFFNDGICVGLPTPPADCFRWEGFGAQIAAGATTDAKRVGFDVDKSVTTFTVYVVVAADIRERPVVAGATVGGVVASPARGPLEGVAVSIGTRAATTNAAGLYVLTGLASGSAEIHLSGVPEECDDPGPVPIALSEGQVSDGSVSVVCRARVRGRVTSPRLGPLDGVQVSDQDGRILAVTDPGGAYLVSGIESDVVTLELGRLPTDCRTPLPLVVRVNPGRTVFAPDILVTCMPAQVVFTAPGVGGEDDLYIMKVDGTERRQLTFTTAEENFPALSPDLSQIAFNRGAITASQIWTMNVDGTGERVQAQGTISWPAPRWMFDGRSLVTFNQMGFNGLQEDQLVLSMFDDAFPVSIGTLTGILPVPAYGDDRIAWIDDFSSPQGGIFIFGLSGEVPPQVIGFSSPLRVAHLNWAPDGRQIVFESSGRILTQRTDVAGGTVVLTSGPDDRNPVYSPDGAFIYFIRNGAFYRMNRDGTNAIEIVPAAQFGAEEMDVR